MKYLTFVSLIISTVTSTVAQKESVKKDDENRILANKILEEHGMTYYDSGSYHIVFDWQKTRPHKIDFASFEKTLRETVYHGERLKMLKESLCVYSESITAEEISNTIFKNKEGKEARIKDVAKVERLKRTSTGAVDTPSGLFINCRTRNNEPQMFLYINNTISESKDLKNYIVFQYSPSANELLVAKYDIHPYGDSMCHEIFTYGLNSKQLKRQDDFGWIYGTPKYSARYDSIHVTVNEKNADGVGSRSATRSVKVK